ncbi:hypothetical protein [Streptomyces sp. NPDC058330]|uniref:hypothetical protein n=1 Tax=Streptomyces sp. NPDC058330 TaxID=3346449 RepID=UPI0036E8B7A9
MHMKSAPHLLTEDRPAYERILADALRHAHERPDLDGIGGRLTAERLRTMALDATALITAAAAPEYDHYVKVRGELRRPAGLAEAHLGLGSAQGGQDRTGAGALAVIAALAPVLAGTAALIFLLVGYLLKAFSPSLSFAGTMVTAGWFFAVAAAVAILVAAVGLLVTALRNGATALPAMDEEQLPEDVARARDAWRHALLERGILPFLRDALADPATGPATRTPHRSAQRIPKIGYSRPDFSGPQEGRSAGPRPTFTSPDFTSPDFGGPEHQPE